jgi:UDP-N-acetylglucosamine--N-acetylmuramyl-(pentapeptide) pyrophosphoryl-undecaprenol N-acetylglucosamine transferase
MMAGLNTLQDKGIQLIWQTGKNFYPQAEEALREKNLPANLRSYPFISRMDLAYAMADVVVSRAGAISISELCLSGKPAILVPSPNVTEDHQTKNAKALSDKNAAILLPDNQAKARLVNTLISLVQDETRKATLSANISKMGYPDAAERIAQEVNSLIKS